MPPVARAVPMFRDDVPRYVPPTTLHVNIKKHKLLSNVKPKQKVTFYVTGKVEMVRKDKDEEAATIDITDISEEAPSS